MEPSMRRIAKMTTSVHAIQKKLSKYDAMAHAATKELQKAGLDEFQVVAMWDNENGIDTFYLRRREDVDTMDNWIELWECKHCPSAMALASDATVLANSWHFSGASSQN